MNGLGAKILPLKNSDRYIITYFDVEVFDMHTQR